MDSAPGFPDRQNRCPRSSASSSSPGPSLSNARSTPCGDEPARKRARRDGRSPENNSNGRQGYGYTNSSISGSARAHFGDHYSHIYNYNSGPAPASHPHRELDLDVVSQIMESLSFAQMDVRRDTISRAHSNTCDWIFDRQEYIDWRDENLMSDHCGFFWIKSKPGAGKSTLMKFLLRTAHERIPGDTVISFFFNARGEELERSLEGCYRGMLYQLLTKIPRLRVVLDCSKMPTNSVREWSLDSLREMLSEAILLLGEERLTCFIDALDECPEADIRDMVDFFEELGKSATDQNISLHVCLSSRYYPQVSIANCRHMQLDHQDGHQQDIAKYVKSKLKVRRGKTADELREAVQEKSHGIFMWVVLVTRILNEESDRGSNNADLRRCLERIPSELHELFRDILQRGIQDDQDLVPILQWISFARRPLTREELYFAIRSGKPDFTPSVPWDPDEDSPEAMDLFILNASKGLAETTKGKTPKIQFIHESVRDYLRDTGFEILAPNLNVSLRGSAHDYIRHCCYRWISEEIVEALALPRPLPKVTYVGSLRELRDAATTKFPFLEYCVNNVLHHAELAWCGGVSQQRFVEDFRFSPWLRINALFAKYERDRFTAPADTLTCALAAYKALMLLEAEVQLNIHCLTNSQLDAALRVSLVNETRPLLGILESGHPRYLIQLTDKTIEAAVKTQSLGSLRITFERGFYTPLTRKGWRPILNEAAETGNVEILKLLFKEGAVVVDSWPMFYACTGGQARVLSVLIAHGSDVNAIFYNGTNPLVKSCTDGHLAAAQALIEHGANVNTALHLNLEYGDHITPLFGACSNGYENIVRVLLDNGADPNLAVGNQWTPLRVACLKRYKNIVSVLLDNGADPNLAGENQRTLLSQACSDRYEHIASMMLAKRVNVNSRQNDGPLLSISTSGLSHVLDNLFLHGLNANIQNGSVYLHAVCLASRFGDEETVRTLLAHGTGVQHQASESYRAAVLEVTNARHSQILELLLDESEGFRVQDKSIYRDSLRQAEELGFSDIVKVLRERGVNLPEASAT